MLKIALTGGIGSGKSSVCGLFADFGVAIIDADLIARQLVEPQQPSLTALVQHFGNSILNRDGTLNRLVVRERVFADPKQKQQLDAIMHPRIYAAIDAEIATLLNQAYCIIAIPLLVETGQTQRFDRVLLVDCPVETQLMRVMQRDQLTQQQAQAIFASQASRQQRLDCADDIIDNATTIEQLAEQVKSLHNSYLLLATARTHSA